MYLILDMYMNFLQVDTFTFVKRLMFEPLVMGYLINWNLMCKTRTFNKELFLDGAFFFEKLKVAQYFYLGEMEIFEIELKPSYYNWIPIE